MIRGYISPERIAKCDKNDLDKLDEITKDFPHFVMIGPMAHIIDNMVHIIDNDTCLFKSYVSLVERVCSEPITSPMFRTVCVQNTAALSSTIENACIETPHLVPYLFEKLANSDDDFLADFTNNAWYDVVPGLTLIEHYGLNPTTVFTSVEENSGNYSLVSLVERLIDGTYNPRFEAAVMPNA